MKTAPAKILLSLIAYLAVYATLSLCGRYEDNATVLEDLGLHYRWISDLYEWQPAFMLAADHPGSQGENRNQSANLLGMCFLPLVSLDQSYWHSTHPIAPDGYAEPPGNLLASLIALAAALCVWLWRYRYTRSEVPESGVTLSKWSMILLLCGLIVPYAFRLFAPCILSFVPYALFEVCFLAGVALCFLPGKSQSSSAAETLAQRARWS